MTASAPTGHTRLACVIGDPVRHSLSPAMFNAAFAAAGIDWTYVALPVATGSGASAVEAMRTLGIAGMSVTMPHKQAVAAAVDRRSAAVEALGAANCVRWDGGVLCAENTDGEGFVRSLGEVDFDVAGASCVVAGAGGAARAVIAALASAGASSVGVVNRTPDKAAEAAQLAGSAGFVATDDDVAGATLLVNATPVGMGDDDRLPIDASLIGNHHTVADLIYHPAETSLLSVAAQAGAATLNGLGMLLHQAAVQFEFWTGLDAPIDAMRAGALMQLDGG